jgi:ribosome-binding factor A
MNSFNRSDRLGNQLHREIGNVIHFEITDPRLQFVTVTEVRLARNLKDATVFIAVMGDDRDEVFARLVHAGTFIRKRTAERCSIKFMPRLNFKLDLSRERGAKIDNLLNQVKNDLEEDSSESE